MLSALLRLVGHGLVNSETGWLDEIIDGMCVLFILSRLWLIE